MRNTLMPKKCYAHFVVNRSTESRQVSSFFWVVFFLSLFNRELKSFQNVVIFILCSSIYFIFSLKNSFKLVLAVVLVLYHTFYIYYIYVGLYYRNSWYYSHKNITMRNDDAIIYCLVGPSSAAHHITLGCRIHTNRMYK